MNEDKVCNTEECIIMLGCRNFSPINNPLSPVSIKPAILLKKQSINRCLWSSDVLPIVSCYLKWNWNLDSSMCLPLLSSCHMIWSHDNRKQTQLLISFQSAKLQLIFLIRSNDGKWHYRGAPSEAGFDCSESNPTLSPFFLRTSILIFYSVVSGLGHNFLQCYSSQLIRLWYLPPRQPAKTQASLRIRTVLSEPSLFFAHMKYGSRQRVWPNIRRLAPLDGCACTFEEWVNGGGKVPYSHLMAHL